MVNDIGGLILKATGEKGDPPEWAVEIELKNRNNQKESLIMACACGAKMVE
jgi:hypothetical protein